MKAKLVFNRRVVIADNAFAELVLWQVPEPVRGSTHNYKYSLAFVVEGKCVLRYDNEAGKGDHRHFGGQEQNYRFASVDALLADFTQDIRRWQHENS